MGTVKKGFCAWRSLPWILLAALFVVSVLAGCRTVMTCGQWFAYPPGAPADSTHNQYRMYIGQSSVGHTLLRNEKSVEIKVLDMQDQVLADDSFKLTAAGIRANVEWKTPELIRIALVEEGSAEFAKTDEYNHRLLESGPRTLLTLVYRFDPERKQFRRTLDASSAP